MRFHIGQQCGGGGGAIGDIELQHARLPAERANLRSYCFGLVNAATAMHHYVMPGLGHAQGDRLADATTGPGHQDRRIPLHCSLLSR